MSPAAVASHSKRHRRFDATPRIVIDIHRPRQHGSRVVGAELITSAYPFVILVFKNTDTLGAFGPAFQRITRFVTAPAQNLPINSDLVAVVIRLGCGGRYGLAALPGDVVGRVWRKLGRSLLPAKQKRHTPGRLAVTFGGGMRRRPSAGSGANKSYCAQGVR